MQTSVEIDFQGMAGSAKFQAAMHYVWPSSSNVMGRACFALL